jgi:hypothetical protein
MYKTEMRIRLQDPDPGFWWLKLKKSTGCQIPIFSSVAGPGCVSRISDPTFSHPGSRIRTVSIPDPGSSSKILSILTQKKAKKGFLSSKKYDPGCSSRIPDPDADFLPSRIPDPGSRGQKGTESRIRIRNTDIFF